MWCGKIYIYIYMGLGFPRGSEIKVSACNAGYQNWVRFLGWEDPLEKEMAPYSIILAWRIPWTEEPCGLQSTGLQRVGQDCAVCICNYIWASRVALRVNNPPAKAGDIRHTRSTPGLGRSPGGGGGNPLQYSCLENPMDRGAWQAIFHRVALSVVTEVS